MCWNGGRRVATGMCDKTLEGLCRMRRKARCPTLTRDSESWGGGGGLESPFDTQIFTCWSLRGTQESLRVYRLHNHPVLAHCLSVYFQWWETHSLWKLRSRKSTDVVSWDVLQGIKNPGEEPVQILRSSNSWAWVVLRHFTLERLSLSIHEAPISRSAFALLRLPVTPLWPVLGFLLSNSLLWVIFPWWFHQFLPRKSLSIFSLTVTLLL